MKIHLTPGLRKELKKISSRDQKLTKKIEKQLSLFAENPKHPSLRVHKLSGPLKNFWSISVTRSIRMSYTVEDDTAIFSDIGTHDEVYQK